MSVKLKRAGPDDAELLQNLFQFYVHDFSEFWAGSPRGEVSAVGLFDAYPLEPYWETPGWEAFTLWAGQAPAGFALVNDQSHDGLPTDHGMAEFFVLRKHRGAGAGRTAAHALFAARPGVWEVAVTARNLPARAFWRSTILSSPGSDAFTETEVQPDNWNGPVMRFTQGVPLERA